jgi:periplasmic divalent cation tolerance protein
MNVLIVYTTCKTPEEAHAIAASVIEKRLAACANILAAHSSIYEWEGRVQTESETAMILKTTEAQFEALKAEILTLHVSVRSRF